MKANIGKPITRIRQEIALPQREALAPEGFKVLPITPRATKSPGWKLGSGFDGMTLRPSPKNRPRTSRNRKVGNVRTPGFLSRSLPKLEMTNRISPSHRSVGHIDISKKQRDQGGPSDTRAFEPANELDTPDDFLKGGPAIDNDGSETATSSHQNGTIKEPFQLRLSKNRGSDAYQSIREPSRSERNGWLKRRRVDFAAIDEDEDERLFNNHQKASVNASGHERKFGRDSVDAYLKTPLQAQHASDNDLQVSIEFSRAPPTLKQSVTRQQQELFQDEPSAQPHRRRALHAAEEKPPYTSEEILDQNGSYTPPQSPSLNFATNFPTSTFHPTGPSMPNPRNHIQVPRTSEIPETQERLHESIELDPTRAESLGPDHHPFYIADTALDSGTYFSKAVQQLDSLEEVPHTVTRRKSRREPDEDARGSSVMMRTQTGAHHGNIAPFTGDKRAHVEEGPLELSVTSRLKRRMSNVPFRPPFKESL